MWLEFISNKLGRGMTILSHPPSSCHSWTMVGPTKAPLTQAVLYLFYLYKHEDYNYHPICHRVKT
jgi:hypothetical protein